MPRSRAKYPGFLDTLRALPLFSSCSDDELARIDALSDEVHVPAGREVMRQGEVGREFAVICSGEAEVERDGRVIATLGPGDHFGELALLGQIPRNATVRATSELVLEVIDRRAFHTLLEDSPGLTRNLLAATARRLAEVDTELAVDRLG